MNEVVEEWKDIPGYEGYYQASTLGRVRSVDRVIQCGFNKDGSPKFMKLKGQIRKVTLKYQKYCPCYIIVLQKNHKSKCMQLSTLLADTFIPKPEGKVKVWYKNGKTFDCRIDNLYWTSDFSYKQKSIKPKQNKVTNHIVDIKTMKAYKSYNDASLHTGLSVSKIQKYIKNRKRFEKI